MKLKKLPNSDLVVTELSLGTLTFGDQVNKYQSMEIIDAATKEYGIDFLVQLIEIYHYNFHLTLFSDLFRTHPKSFLLHTLQLITVLLKRLLVNGSRLIPRHSVVISKSARRSVVEVMTLLGLVNQVKEHVLHANKLKKQLMVHYVDLVVIILIFFCYNGLTDIHQSTARTIMMSTVNTLIIHRTRNKRKRWQIWLRKVRSDLGA